MHAKFLALLAIAPLALAQDWLDDAMDALESTGPVPTDSAGDAPTLDDYLENSDIYDDIETTNDFGSDDTSSSSSSSSTSSDSSDDTSDSSDYGNILGNVPSSIISELATAIPPSVLQDLATPASVSSLMSEIADGNFPAWVTDLPDDVKDYLETAWGATTLPTGSSSSSDDDSSSNSNSNSNSNSSSSGGDDQDAAGMLSPSILASVVGAVGVLGVALAL
ncbi:hypothetical protein BJY01DRAFT_255895 [Aspergillus pseudoustus]|uniref:Ser-Thr-rich glycosyl-phosphatidyl-inositol-anchored membrane family-domain-containing protein n=1 Tax=Aspergillus pseudoustus TaxID=1810923 RepID=A0ABR4IGA8_9EURO